MVSEPALDDLDYERLSHFRYELLLFLRKSEHAARSAGVEPQQHQLLLFLKALNHAGNEPSIKELAEWLQLKHHSVVELLARLERQGLVLRQRQPDDQRWTALRLTAAGEEVIQNLSQYHWDMLQTLGPSLILALAEICRTELMLAGTRLLCYGHSVESNEVLAVAVCPNCGIGMCREHHIEFRNNRLLVNGGCPHVPAPDRTGL